MTILNVLIVLAVAFNLWMGLATAVLSYVMFPVDGWRAVIFAVFSFILWPVVIFFILAVIARAVEELVSAYFARF